MSDFVSKPEAHDCGAVARVYLEPFKLGGQWFWRIKHRYWNGKHAQVTLLFCPWCGERLPERGRLRVDEVQDGTDAG